MFAKLTAASFLSLGFVTSDGASDTARYITERETVGRLHFQSSFMLGDRLRDVREDLYAVTEDCAKPNWDAYGAEPVRSETYHLAYRFLNSLPIGTPLPQLGAEPDGHLTLEWYSSPRHTLSVSLSPEGDLHYAALLGPNKAYGTEAFFGVIPNRIFDLIQQVYVS